MFCVAAMALDDVSMRLHRLAQLAHADGLVESTRGIRVLGVRSRDDGELLQLLEDRRDRRRLLPRPFGQ